MGVAPYLFQFFRVHYCAAVKREIISTDPTETTLVYPQAVLFQIFDEDKRLHQAEPRQSLRRFGAGEAHAIALAQERNWRLLINDYKPLVFAQSIGIACMCVPDFCVLLYAAGKITLPAVNGFLKRLSPTTSPVLITLAETTLGKIIDKKGDDV